MKYLGALQMIDRNSRWSARLLRALAICVLAGAVVSVSAAETAGNLSADYARWIKPWSEHTNMSSRLGAELKVVVTFVSGEKPLSVVTNLTPVERLNLAYHLKTAGSEVTANGACWSYFASNVSATEAPVRQLTAAELQQLDELLAHLPDDGSALPPPGRRIIVQVREQGRWRIGVYDRTSAPPEVQAILKLIGNPFAKSL